MTKGDKIQFGKGGLKLDLEVFENEEFGQIEIISKDEKEYFEAIKIARILGYSNPYDAINRHCNEYGIVFHEVRVATGKRKG